MGLAGHKRGHDFAAAVEDEIARHNLACSVTVEYLSEQDLVRLTVVASDHRPTRAFSYPPTVDSIRPILRYLQIQSRIALLRKQLGEQQHLQQDY